MYEWTGLSRGDIVDIVAPSFATKKDEFLAAIDYLESWGLRPRYPKNILQKNYYFSKNDDFRWKHFKAALQKKDSKILWALRGGCGSIELMPHLYRFKKLPQPKLLVGLSDISFLHIAWSQRFNSPSLHARVLFSLPKTSSRARDRVHTEKLLIDPEYRYTARNLRPLNAAALKKQVIYAPVTGGNLTTLAASLGSPWQLSAQSKILILEDIGERAYRVDRCLSSLYYSGALKGCRAIIFADFLHSEDPDGKNRIRQAWLHLLEKINIPAFCGLRTGHGRYQLPIVFGVKNRLYCGSKSASLEVSFR